MEKTAASTASTAQEAKLVESEDLERHLAILESEVEDPRAGLFGPDSMMWQINREAVLFLGGGRAALLQLAHPFIAEAIHQHSDTRSDPLGRFRRTFASVFAMVFGDLSTACEAARRVHGVHRRIVGRFEEDVGQYEAGSRYRANEQHSLLWVHATLWETSISVFERVVRPLSGEEKEQYYRETRLFARLFGIDTSLLPTDWNRFEAYNQDMWSSSRLSVGGHAKEIGSFLFHPYRRSAAPMMRWLRIMTAGLLPESLRSDFGLRFSARDRRVHKISLGVVRRTRRAWPARVRFLPPYISALRRLSGNAKRDVVGEGLTRLWIGKQS